MSIHHPPAELLEDFAAGLADDAQRIMLATHLHHCASCRRWVGALEQVGGAVLEGLVPSPMSADALARVRVRLAHVEPAPPSRVAPPEANGLTAFMARLEAKPWSWVAPGIQIRRVSLGECPSRLFFLRSKAGARFIPHSHSGMELTCVLQGGFEHDGVYFEPGDIDVGAPGIDHAIRIAPGEPCVSLVEIGRAHV